MTPKYCGDLYSMFESESGCLKELDSWFECYLFKTFNIPCSYISSFFISYKLYLMNTLVGVVGSEISFFEWLLLVNFYSLLTSILCSSYFIIFLYSTFSSWLKKVWPNLFHPFIFFAPLIYYSEVFR